MPATFHFYETRDGWARDQCAGSHACAGAMGQYNLSQVLGAEMRVERETSLCCLGRSRDLWRLPLEMP